MTREQRYKEQMLELGIWQEAFAPEVHTLAMMERELQRMVRAWKDAGSPVVDYNDKDVAVSNKTLDAIGAHRRDILARKEALGLTPRALRRLRRDVGESPQEPRENVLTLLRGKRAREA